MRLYFEDWSLRESSGDGVCGGDAYFHQKIEELQKVLPFGSRKHQSFVFTGIQLEQFPDHSIRASQCDYIHRIPSIDRGRLRRQDLDAPVNEDERTKLRGLIGSLQYAVTHTRPDVAAGLGEVQCQTTTATVQTLLLANKVLREAQEYHQVSVVFRAIPGETDFCGVWRCLLCILQEPELPSRYLDLRNRTTG